MKKIIGAVVILSISITSFGYALDVSTHMAINEYITQNTLMGFSLDSHLKNQLGIQAGKNEQFISNNNSQEAWRWIRIGGKYEDDPPGLTIPYIRSNNHFHNPINKAGFNGIGPSIPGITSGISAKPGHGSGPDIHGASHSALLAFA